jgi:hypothetical protein
MYNKQRIWKYKLAGELPREQNIANNLRLWVEGLKKYHKWRIMLQSVWQYLNV